MTLEEAISLVSYKLALKQGEKALEDPILDPDTIHRALKDQSNNTEEKIDLKAYMAATKMLKQHKIDTFKQQNTDFLVENAKRPEVKLTPSGLQYEIIREGTGDTPQLNDTVSVHYRGSLTSGKEFDSSYAREEASSFAIKKVILGWQEGLQLMKEGAYYKFYIPQELGYEDSGNDSKVPGYATLIFDVELLAKK